MSIYNTTFISKINMAYIQSSLTITLHKITSAIRNQRISANNPDINRIFTDRSQKSTSWIREELEQI